MYCLEYMDMCVLKKAFKKIIDEFYWLILQEWI